MEYIATTLLAILIGLILKIMSQLNIIDHRVFLIEEKQNVIKLEIENALLDKLNDNEKKIVVVETNLVNLHKRVKHLERNNAN